MTVPHDDDQWTPSSLTGTDSSLTGSALDGSWSAWSSGTSTSTGSDWSSSTSSTSMREPAGSSLGSARSSEDPPVSSTARYDAQTSLRLDSITTPHAQGPVSARIGQELLGGGPAARTAPAPTQPNPGTSVEPPEPGAGPAQPETETPGPEPAARVGPPQGPPPAPELQQVPPRPDQPTQGHSPRHEPTPPAPEPPAALRAAPAASPPPSPYRPPEPVPYDPNAPITPSFPVSAGHAGSRTATGRIRSMADLERAKAEYDRGHSAVPAQRASARRNGAFSTLILGLISVGMVTVGGVQGSPAPTGSVAAFVVITVITGLVTMAKPVEPAARNRALAAIGILLGVAAIVLQVIRPW